MENVVASIFAVESEGFKALAEIRQKPVAEGYSVIEAALIKREGDGITFLDGFDTGAITTDDTATGMIVGSLVGVLGGPLGVLLGASIGAWAGGLSDAADSVDSGSMIVTVANKLVEGEVALIALVQEEEPAFDAPFAAYETLTIRFSAADVADEVNRAREVEADLAHQALAKMRADRAGELDAAREERAQEATKRAFEVYGDEIPEEYKKQLDL